jgi:hypothetical protein
MSGDTKASDNAERARRAGKEGGKPPPRPAKQTSPHESKGSKGKDR